MKVVIAFYTWTICLSLFGAAVRWSGIAPVGLPCEETDNGTVSSQIEGGVGVDGAGALILGMFFTHEESSFMRLKAYDYSITAAPVNTQWFMAAYGDILGVDTILSFKRVELCDYYERMR